MIYYGREFSIIHRYSRIYMTRILERFGLSGRMMPYIMVISNDPGMSQDALAREFRIDKGSVARTVAVLAEKGLIERRSNERDKRENLIYPTDDMKEIYREVCDAGDEFNRILNRGISEEDAVKAHELLTRMAENLIEEMGRETCHGKGI